MDTLAVLINEVKSLKKEVVSIKEENTRLFNELTHQHETLVHAIDFSNSNHLKFHLPRFVGMQTAEFIINNMNKVRFIDDKAEYLQYVLAQTSDIANRGGI